MVRTVAEFAESCRMFLQNVKSTKHQKQRIEENVEYEQNDNETMMNQLPSENFLFVFGSRACSVVCQRFCLLLNCRNNCNSFGFITGFFVILENIFAVLGLLGHTKCEKFKIDVNRQNITNRGDRQSKYFTLLIS